MNDPAGSSVPEAARAAAIASILEQHDLMADGNYRCICGWDGEGPGRPTFEEHQADQLLPAVAAAVAEERATTGRRIEAVESLPDEWDRMADQAYLVATSGAYRFCADHLRAALASPGDGQLPRKRAPKIPTVEVPKMP